VCQKIQTALIYLYLHKNHFTMKVLFFVMIFSIIYFVPKLPAQNANFEGVIKYIPLNPAGVAGDTLIIYFGKQKIRTTRMGTLAEKFGGVTEEITDFATAPNQTFVYYGARKEQQVIQSTKSGIDSVVTYSDSNKVILGFNCVKSDIFFGTSAYMGTHRIVDVVWSAPRLPYLAPSTAFTSPWHPDNSSGGIPLLYMRMVYSELMDGSQRVTSTNMIACEVIARSLPDSIFIIP